MSTLIDDEYDEKVYIQGDKKSSVIQKLNEMELLRYGAIITDNDVSYAMGEKKHDLPIDKWNFVKLQFREIIKNQGFYVTSRGREDNLYILMPHEMASYNEARNKSQFRNLKQRQRALHMVDESMLSEEQAKKLEFEILRNASLELEMATKLKERCRY